MRPVIIVLSIPALLAAALLATQAPAQNSTPRPDPIPPVQDMVFVPAGDFLMGSTVQDVYRIADVDEWPACIRLTWEYRDRVGTLPRAQGCLGRSD